MHSKRTPYSVSNHGSQVRYLIKHSKITKAPQTPIADQAPRDLGQSFTDTGVDTAYLGTEYARNP